MNNVSHSETRHNPFADPNFDPKQMRGETADEAFNRELFASAGPVFDREEQLGILRLARTDRKEQKLLDQDAGRLQNDISDFFAKFGIKGSKLAWLDAFQGYRFDGDNKYRTPNQFSKKESLVKLLDVLLDLEAQGVTESMMRDIVEGLALSQGFLAKSEWSSRSYDSATEIMLKKLDKLGQNYAGDRLAGVIMGLKLANGDSLNVHISIDALSLFLRRVQDRSGQKNIISRFRNWMRAKSIKQSVQTGALNLLGMSAIAQKETQTHSDPSGYSYSTDLDGTMRYLSAKSLLSIHPDGDDGIIDWYMKAYSYRDIVKDQNGNFKEIELIKTRASRLSRGRFFNGQDADAIHRAYNEAITGFDRRHEVSRIPEAPLSDDASARTIKMDQWAEYRRAAGKVVGSESAFQIVFHTGQITNFDSKEPIYLKTDHTQNFKPDAPPYLEHDLSDKNEKSRQEKQRVLLALTLKTALNLVENNASLAYGEISIDSRNMVMALHKETAGKSTLTIREFIQTMIDENAFNAIGRAEMARRVQFLDQLYSQRP